MGSGYRLLVAFLALSLVDAIFATSVASQYSPIQIKVLSAEFHPIADANPVPKNCDLQNFDAYCNESRNPTGENTMQVRDGEGNSFVITCSVDSRWSKCAELAVGETYEARKSKRGLTLIVYVPDSNGKESTRTYRLAGDSSTPPSATAADSQPKAAAEGQPLPPPLHPVTVMPGQKASDSAPLPAPPPTPSAQQVPSAQVRCKFTSTPSGAEITLDGKYVGSTPSEIDLGAGTHVVLLSMPGFSEWRRELTVSTGSELTVNAILEKQPQ